MKTNYCYMAWKKQPTGFNIAISVTWFKTLKEAREKAKEKGLNNQNGFISKEHKYEDREEKTYKIY